MHKGIAHIEGRVQCLIIGGVIKGEPTSLRETHSYLWWQTPVIDEVFVYAVLSDFIVIVIFRI